MKHLVKLVLISFITLIAVQLAGAWNVPTPAKSQDPAAKAAPASSPTTYPDEKAFQQRAKTIMQGLATNDFQKWRTGYFAGGDPGKYVQGPAMARLMLDPKDAQARKYMNDDRSYKEHYHFAAVNWARFLPLFGDALTPEIRAKLAQQASTYSPYLDPHGTENHKTMWMTSANVLPYYLEGGKLAKLDKAAALARAKENLRTYVKGLYQVGQGEWDSSTYLMFDINGMLNIYDFSPDQECRLMAKAALDWYAAGYAIKYCDGVYTAPNQRGFAPAPVKKIADNTGWLWWGSHKAISAKDTSGFLWTMHPITSGWRPSKVICNIATRNLPTLPVEQRNSKANYWYGRGEEPKANQMQETVYITRNYTMGSLWNGFGGQMTRFQLVASSPKGGIVFTGGHPTGGKFEDGGGQYDQSAQVGGSYISMTKLPADEKTDYAFFSIPAGASRPVRKGDWIVMRAGNTFVGVYALQGVGRSGYKGAPAGKIVLDQPLEIKTAPFDILRFKGRQTGFIVETADTTTVKSVADFARLLQQKTTVDTSRFAADMAVTFTNLAGKTIVMRYQDGQDHAAVSIDKQPVDYSKWMVYGGPYVTANNGVLTVNDGKEGYTVDFTGSLPIYKAWKK